MLNRVIVLFCLSRSKPTKSQAIRNENDRNIRNCSKSFSRKETRKKLNEFWTSGNDVEEEGRWEWTGGRGAGDVLDDDEEEEEDDGDVSGDDEDVDDDGNEVEEEWG